MLLLTLATLLIWFSISVAAICKTLACLSKLVVAFSILSCLLSSLLIFSSIDTYQLERSDLTSS